MRAFDVLALYIVSTSIACVSLLALNVFHVHHAVILGAILFTAFFTVLRIPPAQPQTSWNAGLLMILLIALFFRSEPYLYVMGGQDEGIYVNMSASYERTGSTFIDDNVRKGTSDEQKGSYDQVNQYNLATRVKDKYEGVHLPGIYIQNLSDSKYVFQFYPLHPLWMALFAKVFGPDNRVYSLVFFSLLTIIVFYLLALELSGGRKLPAALTALFLAVNPLHAFFSKFPVSEIVSLYFSGSGFYFLLKYYKGIAAKRYDAYYLFLSAGSFFCLFFNHISGFLYLPFVYLLLAASLIFPEEKTARNQLAGYSLAALAACGLSFIYGYRYSFPYFSDVLNSTFGGYLGKRWPAILLSAQGVLALCLVWMARRREFLKTYLQKNSWIFSAVVTTAIGVIVLWGIVQAYQLGFTAKYAGDALIDHVYHLPGKGWSSLYGSSLFVLMIYASPVLFVCFLYFIAEERNKRDVVITGVLFYLTISMTMRIFLDSIILYHYYYARYMLAEVVPWIIMLASLLLARFIDGGFVKKTVALLAIVSTAVFFLYHTGFQLRGREAAGANESLTRVANYLDKKDMLLVYTPEFKLYEEIATSLNYYYGLNTCSCNNLRDLPQLNSYNNVFLLSQVPLRYPGLTLQNTIFYRQEVLERSQHVPHRFTTLSADLYLYRVSGFPLNKTIVLKNYPYVKNFSDDKVWTSGEGIVYALDYDVQPGDKYLDLQLYGYHPYKDDPAKMHLRVLVDGRELRYLRKSGNVYRFLLDKTMRQMREIKISSATFSPARLKINNDERKLGVDVKLIRIEAGD